MATNISEPHQNPNGSVLGQVDLLHDLVQGEILNVYDVRDMTNILNMNTGHVCINLIRIFVRWETRVLVDTIARKVYWCLVRNAKYEISATKYMYSVGFYFSYCDAGWFTA